MTELDEPPRRAELSFGEELRKEREIRGITLREIADATKISHRFLEAIERNDYKNLPAPVFTKGFIKEYAHYVGLSADSILDHYTHFVREREAEDEAAARPRRSVDPHPSLEISIPSREPNRWIWFAIAGVAIAATCLYYFRARLPFSHRNAGEATTTAVSSVAIAPQTSASADAGNATALRLTIRAREESWISLDADDESVFNEVLSENQERSFTAKNDFRFRTIGNAGGVDLTLNGAALKSLGESGDVVRDLRLDRKSVSESGSDAEAVTNSRANR